MTETAIKNATESARSRADQEIGRIRHQIAQLEAQIVTINADFDSAVAVESQRIRDQADQMSTQAKTLQAKLDAAGELPAIIDTAAITARINKARADNANVRKLEERNKHVSAAKTLEAQSEALTDKITKRQAGKVSAIAAAKIPVAGIDFGDNEVLLNEVPFNQASDAEQLRTSVAIAMALNPKLRVVRIRDGSLLDSDAMLLLAEMAEKHDMQVWIERVDSSGKIGFVLEDGHVRHAAAQVEEESAA